jgi:hypothetical protein
VCEPLPRTRGSHVVALHAGFCCGNASFRSTSARCTSLDVSDQSIASGSCAVQAITCFKEYESPALHHLIVAELLASMDNTKTRPEVCIAAWVYDGAFRTGLG